MDINSMSYHVQKAVSREENIQTELLVIFLLEGRMTLKYQDESYQMKAEDIILINPGVSYEIEGTRDALYGQLPHFRCICLLRFCKAVI